MHRGHRAVKVGDEIDILLGTVRRRVVVAGFGERRGPAPEAQALYTESQPPERLGPAADRPVPRREAGAGRPTKRDRRRTDALRPDFDE